VPIAPHDQANESLRDDPGRSLKRLQFRTHVQQDGQPLGDAVRLRMLVSGDCSFLQARLAVSYGETAQVLLRFCKALGECSLQPLASLAIVGVAR